jgi:hypothetical protein
MMAAIFLVLAVVDAALLANVVLANTAASSVFVLTGRSRATPRANCCCWPPG